LRFFSTHRSAGAPPVSANIEPTWTYQIMQGGIIHIYISKLKNRIAGCLYKYLQWREVTRMLWEDQAGTLDLDEVDFSNTVLGRCWVALRFTLSSRCHSCFLVIWQTSKRFCSSRLGPSMSYNFLSPDGPPSTE
jgi:hypothetical protein